MAVEVELTETLLAVAKHLRDWLPELNGRAIAVTEVDAVSKDSVPTLPIALVAPLRQEFSQRNMILTVEEHFIVEVWFEPAREKMAGVAESPFWSYYRYNKFRDQMFARFAGVRSPQNGAYRFISMDVESNFFATMLTFRMSATYDICAEVLEWEEPAMITFSLCQPSLPDCQLEQPKQEKDPCLAST